MSCLLAVFNWKAAILQSFGRAMWLRRLHTDSLLGPTLAQLVSSLAVGMLPRRLCVRAYVCAWQMRDAPADKYAMPAEVLAIAWLSHSPACAHGPGLSLTPLRGYLRKFHGPGDALRADVACKSRIVFREVYVCVCVDLCRDAFLWRKEGRSVD